jgi:hypothetical protein
MASYIAQLQTAYAQTKNLGYDVDELVPTMPPPQGVTESQGSELTELLAKELGALGCLNKESVVRQCCQVSLAMKGHTERVIGYPVILTIGGVRYKGMDLVEIDEPSVDTMRKTGSYHVWLTLPWMAIIDFTLHVSKNALTGHPVEFAHPIHGYPESFPNYAWKPLFVGTEVARRLI